MISVSKNGNMKHIDSLKRIANKVFIAMLIMMMSVISGCSEVKKDGIRRLDDDGYLYYMDYELDYYGGEVRAKMREAGLIDPGCSAFFTYNSDGEPLSCRNYDYPHRISKQDRSFTGLNIVIHCKPRGKYESIAVADAIWCDPGNPLLRNGPADP